MFLPRKLFSLPLPKKPRKIPEPLRRLVIEEIQFLIQTSCKHRTLCEAIGFALILNNDSLVKDILKAMQNGFTSMPNWDVDMPRSVREAFCSVFGDDISNIYNKLLCIK